MVPVRLNLINHMLALFCNKFACNIALRNPVFRWESCKGSVWESVKKCSRLCSEVGTRGWISREARDLQAAKSCTRAEHAGELNSHASWSTTGQKSRLATQLARGLNSRLSQVARSSHQPTLFLEKLTLRILFSHQYKYPSFPQNMYGYSERKTLREVSSKHPPI